jgi:hypothetical protein
MKQKIRSWLKVCGSLVQRCKHVPLVGYSNIEIIFHRNRPFPGKDAWRKVVGTWEKFPAKEFSVLAGV